MISCSRKKKPIHHHIERRHVSVEENLHEPNLIGCQLKNHNGIQQSMESLLSQRGICSRVDHRDVITVM